MLKTIIVDDEKLSSEVISNYLKLYCNDIEVVASVSSIKTAFKAIKKHNPDFIFLDIEMADGKGFDLLTMFEKVSFKVIFVTAYSEYAVKAFRFSAVDYLLKPVKIDELVSAVERIKAMYDQSPAIDLMTTLINNLRSVPQTLVIPHLKGFEVLKVHEIIMCQADGYCTNFYLTGNKKVVSSKNLKHFNELLADQNFIRIHHSYLININHVTGYSRQGEIYLSEGLKAYLGDSFKNDFVKRFRRK